MKQYRIDFGCDTKFEEVDEALRNIFDEEFYRILVNEAEWIEKNISMPNGNENTALMCSRCHVLNFDLAHDNYCRHCGAKMTGFKSLLRHNCFSCAYARHEGIEIHCMKDDCYGSLEDAEEECQAWIQKPEWE